MTELDSNLVLTSDRLSLRTPQRCMAPCLLEYLSANQERFAPFGPKQESPLSLELVEGMIATRLRSYEQGTGVHFFVFEGSGNQTLVADLSFTNIVRGVFLACHLGFRIDAAYEGKGYMREALARGLRYAFEDLRLHRVMANYVPTNARSGVLLRRLGFSVEGYARDYLFLNGAWQDHVLTSLIAPSPP